MFNLVITEHANLRLQERVSFLHFKEYKSVALNAFSLHDCRPISDKFLCDYLDYLESEHYQNEIRFASIWKDYIFIFSKRCGFKENNIYLRTVYHIDRDTVLKHAIYAALKGSKY